MNSNSRYIQWVHGETQYPSTSKPIKAEESQGPVRKWPVNIRYVGGNMSQREIHKHRITIIYTNDMNSCNFSNSFNYWKGIGPELDDSGESICSDRVDVLFLGEVSCGCKCVFVLDTSGIGFSGSGTMGSLRCKLGIWNFLEMRFIAGNSRGAILVVSRSSTWLIISI